jgi:hypothetical protein
MKPWRDRYAPVAQARVLKLQLLVPEENTEAIRMRAPWSAAPPLSETGGKAADPKSGSVLHILI